MVHRLSFPDEEEIPTPPNHGDAALFFDLTRWREQLARSIVRNHLSMRSEMIATAVNRILLSPIFLRIAEDRGIISKGSLQNIQKSYQDNHDLEPILRPSLALYLGNPSNGLESEDQRRRDRRDRGRRVHGRIIRRERRE